MPAQALRKALQNEVNGLNAKVDRLNVKLEALAIDNARRDQDIVRLSLDTSQLACKLATKEKWRKRKAAATHHHLSTLGTTYRNQEAEIGNLKSQILHPQTELRDVKSQQSQTDFKIGLLEQRTAALEAEIPLSTFC